MKINQAYSRCINLRAKPLGTKKYSSIVIEQGQKRDFSWKFETLQSINGQLSGSTSLYYFPVLKDFHRSKCQIWFLDLKVQRGYI